MDNREYQFPVWATQGGGLVREVGGVYIFVKKPPDFPELGVGDEMPEKWDVIPANNLAREELAREELGDSVFAR